MNDSFKIINFKIEESPEASGTPPVYNSGTFIILGD